MKKRTRILACIFAILLFAGAFASCSKKDLKKGKIIEGEAIATSNSSWQPLTTAARAELEQIYQQKLAATQAFAEAPKPAAGGTTYYISSINGNDNNNGKSPSTAWKTPSKATDVKSGDVVLFECGSTFRRSSNSYFFKTKSGVVYATYGEGAKPIFYGSLKTSRSDWKAVKGKSNLYYYDGSALDLGIENDIGSIIFNDGEAWGIKIQMTYKDKETKQQPANATLKLEGASNGVQTYDIPSYSFAKGADLNTSYDLSFYHDYSERKIYLCCQGGNPAVRFQSVELALNCSAMQIRGKSQSDVTILNLDFRYYGNDPVHPMNLYEDGLNGPVITDAVVKNTTIKNCSFFFIGGTIQLEGYGGWRPYYTRLGNGTTNYGACDGFLVENCYFDQMYDTAVTTQTVHNQTTRNVVFRNNVMQNVWFGVELWAGDDTTTDLEFDNIEVTGNYCRNIGEGLCSTRPDKVDPGTDYSVNAFIKFSHYGYTMKNSLVADNISEGTNGKFILCSQPKTDSNPLNGTTFERNIYVGSAEKANSGKIDFGVLPSAFPAYQPEKVKEGYSLSTKKYSYSKQTVDLLQAHGFEKDSIFYYTDSADCWLQYTYKAANGVEIPFRLIFPDHYTEGQELPLITFLNEESASGTDNLKNVTTNTNVFLEFSSGQNAILLVPQCPDGTWTGLSVDNGNYQTAKVSETKVMRAVAALIRDVAEQYHATDKYAVGVDAGAYAVSDLLARHQNLLAAGIIIAGAGDPSANIGGAEVWVIHSVKDDVVPPEDAEELANAWGAKYTSYDKFKVQHNCWNEAVADSKIDLLGWLLSK